MDKMCPKCARNRLKNRLLYHRDWGERLGVKSSEFWLAFQIDSSYLTVTTDKGGKAPFPAGAD